MAKSSEYWEKRIASETWKVYNTIEEKNKELLQFYIEASYLNYASTNDLPDEIAPAVKELVLIRFNRDGAEGISSESQSSGGSTSYSDMLPDSVRRIIRKYRKLPR